jgi:ribulose-5-phosphate 4-epimerase/fuculose-1-phosphate aldolase
VSAETTDPVDLVVRANRALGAAGQTDLIWGHASARDPSGRGAWMKAAGWGFDEITRDRVVLVSDEGEVLAGAGRRHIEYPIHTEIYGRRSDINAVVHSHASAAVSFASLDVPLRAISHDGAWFSDPDIPRFRETGSLVRSRDLGQALASAIGDGPGCLIPHHGLVTVGATVAEAVMRAVCLERACSVQLAAMAAGELRTWSDQAEVDLKRTEIWNADQVGAAFEYLCRLADRM